MATTKKGTRQLFTCMQSSKIHETGYNYGNNKMYKTGLTIHKVSEGIADCAYSLQRYTKHVSISAIRV